ncbi:cysteine dioxygenase type 1-like isoform X2 [Syngnathus scovelli]|uniref:cysteine dioxygenase type 1-like isoform X2 n=1 Tax=Syngnathus scovelli TaxID=161590 RepID=UPI00210F7FAF|nr:cysteine dioxygenase type 1-like isoform X2 [Syngnathus scovelli]
MPKDLKELIQKLREIFQDDHINVDEVRELMESYRSNPEDWKKYAMFDKQGYTRNLVDEVKGKFNLIVLCWGKGHGSPIHDHSKSDCFMKMLQGELKETQFDWPKEEGREMTEKSHSTLKNNSVAYIHNKIGLHRVENVSHTECAVSLHLYSHPAQTCKVFDQCTGHIAEHELTFWSIDGKRTPKKTTASKENN